MDNIINKQLLEKFKRLPKEVQAAILSVNLSESLQKIVRDNRLLIDQSGKLEMEVIITLLGLEPVSDFLRNIAKELNVSTEKATQIAQDTDTLIFKNIRSSLQSLNLKEEKEDSIVEKYAEGETLSRDQVLNEIENPTKTIPTSKPSIPIQNVSVQTTPVSTSLMKEPENDIVINKVILPQKTDGITITNSVAEKKEIENILEANLKGAVSLPKEQKTIEDKTKLPPKSGGDPYREPIE